MRKRCAIAVGVLLMAPALFAQHGGSISMGRPRSGFSGNAGHRFPSGISIIESGHRHSFGRNPFFYGFPYFYDDDYGPEPVEYVPQEPQSQPASIVQTTAEPLAAPVLLELHGTQWVKVENFGEASQQNLNSNQQSGIQPTKQLAPAILVYRDGHTEEVSSYSIIG